MFLRDSGGPEGTVKSYFSALDSGNSEEAASLVHEDSPSLGPLTDLQDARLNQVDILVDSIEPLNESEAGGSFNASNYETVQEFETLEVTVTASSTASGQEQSQTNTDTAVLAKNTDGEWKMWFQ